MGIWESCSDARSTGGAKRILVILPSWHGLQQRIATVSEWGICRLLLTGHGASIERPHSEVKLAIPPCQRMI